MTTVTKTATPAGLPASTLNRVLDEGYGPGAWYGSDLQTAVADVTPATAFRRPAAGRHNIAEIALHHAYWARQIQKKLTGAEPPAFPLEGEDWFDLEQGGKLSWPEVVAALDGTQHRLSEAVAAIAAGRQASPLDEAERFDVVIGITGHAAYHAGQVQLVKKLIGS